MANASSGIEWKTLSSDSVRSLLGPRPAPCLSLYLPTHRNVPENRVDRPRYRHLVESLELALAVARPRAKVERLLHPFRVLDGDDAFWEHTHDGVAIFAADGLACGFVLERPVTPLALVAAAPLAATFRKISRNPWLVEEQVPRDGHLLSRDELAALVAPHLAAHHLRRVERETHAVEQAHGRGRLLADLAEIGRAAVAGQIATLYVEADRFEPGHFDRDTGFIAQTTGKQVDLSLSGDQPASGFEDVLGSLAETVLEKGGGVVVVAAASLPTRSGAGAICRS